VSVYIYCVCCDLTFCFRYKKRVARALSRENILFPTVMSMIVDGMEQSHCQCPYLGSQTSFSDPLKQCLTGVKEHGVGLTLYRTIDTVVKGANLTIHCVLSQIETWKKRNGRYPEEIYLQVDGGSENANQYLLAQLELLVIKRIARLILFTRLPTGHTHEDIDACFGVIWNCCKGRPCETLQQYMNRIVATFAETALRAVMIDVMVVPDYKHLLRDCVDSKLKNLHKDIQTQHQWRFEAVEQSVYFPLGCKTTYRAYSSDVVVEFVKKPKLQCLSSVGQYTGLEPVQLHCRWYPSAQCDASRPNVEGFYLLWRMPHADNGTLPPCPFPDLVVETIQKTLSEIRKRYDVITHSVIREQWDSWRDAFAPTVNDAVEYVRLQKLKGRAYHIPLKLILLNKQVSNQHNTWSHKLSGNNVTDINPGFVWTNAIVNIFQKKI
jgi:hypothetical protein